MASSPPSWVVLPTIPRVSAADGDLPLGADLSLALAAPPGVSVLTLPPRIAPDPINKDDFPSVLAADRSGLLLIHATQGARTGGIKTFRDGCAWRSSVDGYFIFDAPSATAFRLPDPGPEGGRIIDAGNVGLITAPNGSAYMVAELQPIIGTDLATLLCFSSDKGLWVDKTIERYPLERRPWGGHGVISYLGQLWWIDVSWGLLKCDPFQDQPELEFVHLPMRKKLPFQSLRLDLHKYRCLQVSDSKIRFVDICMPEKPNIIVHRLKNLVRRHDHRKVPWIVLWTLCDPEEQGSWRKEHEVSLEEIWSHGTYKAAKLPRKIPKIAFIDPANSNLVYFFVDDYIVGIDLHVGCVLKYSTYQLEHPPRKYHSARFVRAWELPPHLR